MAGGATPAHFLPHGLGALRQSDTDMELSDAPDDLSSWSEAENDPVRHAASTPVQLPSPRESSTPAQNIHSTPPYARPHGEVQPAQLPSPITPGYVATQDPFSLFGAQLHAEMKDYVESIVSEVVDWREAQLVQLAQSSKPATPVQAAQATPSTQSLKRVRSQNSSQFLESTTTPRRSKRLRKSSVDYRDYREELQESPSESGKVIDPDEAESEEFDPEESDPEEAELEAEPEEANETDETFQIDQTVDSLNVTLKLSSLALSGLEKRTTSASAISSIPPQYTQPTPGPSDSGLSTAIANCETAVQNQNFAYKHPGIFPRPNERIIGYIPRQGHVFSFLWKVILDLLAVYHHGPDKPDPSLKPLICSLTRVALCETLPYYRAFQSGEYTSDSVTYGCLLADNAFFRDFMDASVTISRAGGGMSLNAKKVMVQTKDQDINKVGRPLQTNMARHIPVVHLTTKNNPFLPSKAPHEYCVLGHYKPTKIWVEKQWSEKKHVKCVRYRFEKLSSGGEPIWWLPKGTQELAPRGSLPPPMNRKCDSCAQPSDQIYLQGWMCLNDRCKAHWKLVTDTGALRDPHEPDLVYDPRFLKQKTQSWPNEDHVFELMPYDAHMSEDAPAHSLYNKHAWKGIVCPKCTCCIPRLAWKGWKCQTPGCDYQRIAPRKVIPATSLREIYHCIKDSYTFPRDKVPENMRQYVIVEPPVYAYNYTIVTYRFVGVDAFITHLIPNETVLVQPGGPDDIFSELQSIDIGLERRTNGPRNDKNARPTRHMNVNFGVPYNFIASNLENNRNFDDTNTNCIPNARSLMKWATELVFALQQGRTPQQVAKEWHHKQYNELLTLAYFEDQEIGWHDDGEKGLGPTIATLSLGCTGSMKVRMKQLMYHGVSTTEKRYYDHKHRPLPGCLKYEERLAAHDQILANVPVKDANDYFAKVGKKLGLTGKGVPKTLLDMTLGHGDIVIMHGDILQEYFDHGVEHEGLLRAAMTCRYIDPKSVSPEVLKYTVKPDHIGYDGAKLPIPRNAFGQPIGDPFGVWK